MRRAVLLDRDGTLIEDVGYIDSLSKLRLLPYTVDALSLLKRAGFALVVVTNQGGIGKGLMNEAFVEAFHRELGNRLARAGASIDAFYYCPHHPDATVEAYRQVCTCRKPAPGMAERAGRELDLDLTRSFVIGDRWLDVALAARVGARGLLVRTGYGEREAALPEEGVEAAAVVDHLLDAAHWILTHGGSTDAA